MTPCENIAVTVIKTIAIANSIKIINVIKFIVANIISNMLLLTPADILLLM